MNRVYKMIFGGTKLFIFIYGIILLAAITEIVEFKPILTETGVVIIFGVRGLFLSFFCVCAWQGTVGIYPWLWYCLPHG